MKLLMKGKRRYAVFWAVMLLSHILLISDKKRRLKINGQQKYWGEIL